MLACAEEHDSDEETISDDVPPAGIMVEGPVDPA